MGNLIVSCDVCHEPLSRPPGSRRSVHPACGLQVIGASALVIPTDDEVAVVAESRVLP